MGFKFQFYKVRGPGIVKILGISVLQAQQFLNVPLVT